MGLPNENEEGYAKGEIWGQDLKAAKNLKFTVIHGTGDDNVQRVRKILSFRLIFKFHVLQQSKFLTRLYTFKTLRD